MSINRTVPAIDSAVSDRQKAPLRTQEVIDSGDKYMLPFIGNDDYLPHLTLRRSRFLHNQWGHFHTIFISSSYRVGQRKSLYQKDVGSNLWSLTLCCGTRSG
jgi:hypothetical protein